MPIKFVEQFDLWLCLMTQVSDIASNDRIILLLDKTVVVLAVRPRPSEGDLFLHAVAEEMIVDKFAAVVRIDHQKIKQQPLLNLEERYKDSKLRFVAHSNRFSH